MACWFTVLNKEVYDIPRDYFRMNLLPQQMRSQAKEYLSRYGLVLAWHE